MPVTTRKRTKKVESNTLLDYFPPAKKQAIDVPQPDPISTTLECSTSTNSTELVDVRLVFLTPKDRNFENYIITPISNVKICPGYLEFIIDSTYLVIQFKQLNNDYSHYFFPTLCFLSNQNWIIINRISTVKDLEEEEPCIFESKTGNEIIKIHNPNSLIEKQPIHSLELEDKFWAKIEEILGKL